MDSINDRKKTDSSKNNASSGLSRLSLRKTYSFNDDELGGDAVPKIDQSRLKTKDKEKIERMRHRKDKKKMLLYPED